MMGVRLEMRGLLYTGPRTILHNLRKPERVGVQVDNVITHHLHQTLFLTKANVSLDNSYRYGWWLQQVTTIRNQEPTTQMFTKKAAIRH